MAEDDLTIRASVDASGTQSGAAQAVAAFQQMKAAQDDVATSAVKATAAINTNVSTLTGSAAQIRAAAAANLELAASLRAVSAEAVTYRNLSQGIAADLVAGGGPGNPPRRDGRPERDIKSAAASASVFQQDLGAMASLDAYAVEQRVAKETAAAVVAAEQVKVAAIVAGNAAQLERIRTSRLVAAAVRQESETTAETVSRKTGAGAVEAAAAVGLREKLSAESAKAAAVEVAAMKADLNKKLMNDAALEHAADAKYQAERVAGLEEEKRLGREAAEMKAAFTKKALDDTVQLAASEAHAAAERVRMEAIGRVAARGLSPSARAGMTDAQQVAAGIAQYTSASAAARAEVERLAGALERTESTAVRAGHAMGAAGRTGASGMVTANTELRHVVAGFDELSRHQTGAFVSTLGAALRDSGVIGTVVQRLGSLSAATVSTLGTIGIFGIGAAAAFRAVYEASHALDDTVGRLAVLGQGAEFNRAQIQEWQRSLIRNFGESVASSSRMMESLNALGGSSTALRPQIARLGEAFAAWQNVSSSEGIKQAVAIFKEGSTSALKYAESVRAITPEQATYIEALAKSGQEEQAQEQILTALAKRFGDAGAAMSEAEARLYRFYHTTKDAWDPISLLVRGVVDLSKAFGAFRPDPLKAGVELTPVLRAGQQSAVAETPEQVKRTELQVRLNALKTAEIELEKRRNAARAEGDNQLARGYDLELDRNREAQRNARTGGEKIAGAAATEEHERIVQRSSAELQAAQYSVEKQIEARKRLRDETLRFEAEKIHLAEPDLPPKEVDERSSQTPAAIAAQAAVAEAEKRFAREAMQVRIDAYREEGAEANRGAGARVEAAQSVVDELKRGQVAGIASAQEVAAAEIRVAVAVRQKRDEDYRAFVDGERVKLAAAKSNVTEIARIYDELLGHAAEVYGKDSRHYLDALRERTDALHRANDELINEQLRLAETHRTVDQQQLGLARAAASARVDAAEVAGGGGAANQARLAAYAEELALIQRLAAEETRRYQAIIDNDTATVAEKERAYGQQLEIASRAAEEEMQLAKRVADEQKRQFEESAKVFRSAFSSAGSAVESALEGVLTGQKNASQVTLDLIRSLEKDVLRTATGVGSQKLAEALGGAPGKGLSDVLGDKVARLFGIEPKVEGESVKSAAQAAANQELQTFATTLEKVNALLDRQATDISAAKAGSPTLPGPVASSAFPKSDRFSAASGASLTKGNEPALADITAHAATALPPGYKVVITSGSATSGHVSGSAHYSDKAIDRTIYDPSGRKVPNTGEDKTGMYGRLSDAEDAYQRQAYPQYTGFYRRGSEFGAHGGKVGRGDEADLMHRDVQGYTGPPPSVSDQASSSIQNLGQAAAEAADKLRQMQSGSPAPAAASTEGAAIPIAVPSGAGGMAIGRGGLAILHPEEMVLPARIRAGLEGMISSMEGGGVISAISALPGTIVSSPPTSTSFWSYGKPLYEQLKANDPGGFDPRAVATAADIRGTVDQGENLEVIASMAKVTPTTFSYRPSVGTGSVGSAGGLNSADVLASVRAAEAGPAAAAAALTRSREIVNARETIDARNAGFPWLSLALLGGGAAGLFGLAKLFGKGPDELGSDFSGDSTSGLGEFSRVTSEGSDFIGGDLSGVLDAISGSRGLVVPFAAGGMAVRDGKGGQLAILHPEEMVLPRDLSIGVQRMISRGGRLPSAAGGGLFGEADGGIGAASFGSSLDNIAVRPADLQNNTSQLLQSTTQNLQNTTATIANTLALTRATANSNQGPIGTAVGAVNTVGSVISAVKTVATIAAFLLEDGGVIPSAAGGMLSGGGQLAILHPHEMVLPAPLSQGVQSMIDGGGAGRSTVNAGDVNLTYSPTVNAPGNPSLGDLLERHSQTMVDWIHSNVRSGTLRLPAY